MSKVVDVFSAPKASEPSLNVRRLQIKVGLHGMPESLMTSMVVPLQQQQIAR